MVRLVISAFYKVVDSLLERTTEQDSTTDILELLKALKIHQSSVVENGEATTNLGESREFEVGKLLVVLEGQRSSDRCKVRSTEGSQRAAVVEVHGTSNRAERRSSETLDTTDLNLLSHLKHRHVNVEVISVEGDLEGTSDVDKVRIEGCQLGVLGDGEVLNGSQVQATEIANEGIADGNRGSLSNTSGTKSEGAKLAELVHDEVVDAAKRAHLKVGEEVEAIELESSTNGVEGS